MEVIIIDLDVTNLKDTRLLNKTKNVLNYISNFIQKNTTQSFAIDRFEENFAVCENLKTKEIVNIHISKLPSNTKESDIITLKDNIFYIDKEKTENTKSSIEKLTKNIFENN